MKKQNSYRRRISGINLVALFVLMMAVMASFTSCDETVSSDLGEDITDPVIQIGTINPGDTLIVNYQNSGVFFDVRFLDETGLQSYHIEISKDGNSVIDFTNEALGTQSAYTLDISSLEPNIQYQALVSAVDAAGNEHSVSFVLSIYLEPSRFGYEELFIVGTAAPGGYELALQSPMTISPNNPNIFTWTDTLRAGEFKIKTYAEQDFCAGDWLHPLTASQTLTENGFQILEACLPGNSDYKWNVLVDGIYSITVNFMDESINITQDLILGETFDQVFLVGSASPGGWSLADQTELTQSSTNDFLFSWTGDLVEGEFKFKLYEEEDFCGGKWIHPEIASQALSASEIEVLVGCAENNPDYKWVIKAGQDGTYNIDIDMATRTIAINKQ